MTTQRTLAFPLETPRIALTVRRVLAVMLATLAGSAATVIALRALFAHGPSACGSDCATTLSASPFAVVAGVPALAWAGALHVVLLATTWTWVAWPARRAWLQSAQLALVAVLLGGSATYLVIGLVSGVRCNVCLALHGLAVGVALGTVLLPRVPAIASRHVIAVIVLAFAAWAALAWGVTRARPASPSAAATALSSVTDQWLAAVCQPTTCPGAARFGSEALPDEHASIVLARGTDTTLVAWLDLECAACRADFAAEEPLFRKLVADGKGLRLVLRARSRACDSQAAGGDARACEAPASLVCAARHAGPDAALDLLAWELAAAPGYYTLADRRRTLAALSPIAARCFDAELALGPRGTLGLHAAAARRLATRAASHAGCGADDDPWWCFSATPSFAIFGPASAPSPSSSSLPDDAFAGASGRLRAGVLEQCMEVDP